MGPRKEGPGPRAQGLQRVPGKDQGREAQGREGQGGQGGRGSAQGPVCHVIPLVCLRNAAVGGFISCSAVLWTETLKHTFPIFHRVGVMNTFAAASVQTLPGKK